MRTYYLLFLFLSLLLFSCVHEKADPDIRTDPDLKGDWIWVQKSGGIAGVNITPDNGYNIHYLFDDQKLQITENAITFPAMNYSTTKKKSLLTGQVTDFLLLKTADCSKCQVMSEYTIQISKAKDTLVLNEDVYDGFSNTFVKKRADGWLAATYVGIDPKLCPSPCCGGYLLNIEGITFTTSAFPAGFKMDYSKTPQKLLVKTAPTPFSCAPIPVIVTDAKLLP